MFTARHLVSVGTGAWYRRPLQSRVAGVAVVVFAIVISLLAAPLAAERGSASVATATEAERPPNSADRILFWTGCAELIDMNQSQLTRWHKRGVDGFACTIGHLYGLGGAHQFSGDLTALGGTAYDWERYLRDSKIVARAHRLGMKLYLGSYFANTENAQTPLAEWFADANWTQTVLPAIHGLAAGAKALGFDGLAFDQELYAQNDGRSTATWAWDYNGNTHSEDAVRQEVRERGKKIMETILAAFPKVKILVYGTAFPDVWDDVVQEEVNSIAAANSNYVFIDLWDGMTSVDGYASIQFVNAAFYKAVQVNGASWDNAYTYEYNHFFAMLSQRLSNWAAAADRVSESPFVWISSGSTAFEAARDPGYVAEQLMAARRWGMERTFANYTFDNLRTFDYGPYLAAMRAASKPGVVDDVPPRIQVDAPAVSAGAKQVSLSGTAMDNQAIRVVRWKTDDGHSGAATMEWDSRGDPTSGWTWQMSWKADGVPLHAGSNRIELSAEDIKGLFAIQTVTIAA